MNNFEEFKKKTKTANVIPVVETLPADLLTPLAVYLKLAATAENSFLLESVEGGETLARYSFIGVDPHFTAVGNDSEVTISDQAGSKTITTSMLSFLREHFGNYRVYEDGTLPSFIGGAIGSMNFSCSAWFEPSLKKSTKPEHDESSFMFFRSIVAFDHAKQLIQIVTLVFTDEVGDDENLQASFSAACKRNSEIKDILEHGELHLPKNGTDADSQPAVSNWEKADFENAVAEIKELINAGEAYQVVISQCFTKPTTASPVAIYRAIRSLNPSPYMFLIRTGGKSVIGASPEMLVRVRGRDLEYRPIAGTRPRGTSTEEDVRLAEEMRADRKEVAEHLMLVDLGRNDLGRVAEFGSVKVDILMNVEKYSHVQHLVSYLSATLRDGLDRFDALASCFPAGTVSGAPKVRAIEIIQNLEPTARGAYAGAVGYFDYAGNMDTCIAIRTLVLENGVAKIQAGAGIVADSVPELEYQETVNKARAMIKAVEIAERSEPPA
ncbi:MAG TPA: anthranilate synthase component I family protein [Pyrinomonadaceae bacterium]|nr:anthranilate synthase component I family protein [Pyrinomonadaceae bacterium]